MMNYAPLHRAIDEITRPYNTYPDASSFDAIKDQYEERYGAKNWTKELVRAMFGTSVNDKNAFAKNSPEWKQAKKDYDTDLRLIQRYGKGTINAANAKPGIQTALADIGRALDPIKRDAPPQGITFEITFNAKPEKSGHHARPRTASNLHMDYAAATQFIQDPNYKDLFDLWYDDGGDDFGEDGEYEADVTGVTAS